MATLVLTVIGNAVGGPIGSAVGAVVGQQIDRAIFRPKGREGPRLTDLAIQTSSYGGPIPKIFGTMRVAGTVIWSTDLIESRRRSRAGKGQPTVTSYSYSASFAVLLSARAVRSVGRIWADGKLLRGAAGDFKTATDFRLHPGSEDQPPDPLIAAAEGASAPAHRGMAYAVFENFQLADYGNRIPSLTFEVIADAAPVPVGAITAALSDGVVQGDGPPALPGFSAYGDSVRGVIEALAQAGGAWFRPEGARLAMRHDTGVAERAIDDAGYAARGRGVRGAGGSAAIDTVPKTLTLGHYDPARDYQTGVQRAVRPGAGERHERRELAAAISAADAKQIAEASLLRAETERETRRIAASWALLDLAPGTVVTIAGESGRWRVARWSLEAMVLTLELVRVAPVATASGPASSGRVLASPDIEAGTTIVHAFELPPLDDALLAQPRLLVAAAGTAPGWRRASLLYSIDDGARWETAGPTALPAVIGTLATPLAAAGAALRDLAGAIEIELAHDAMTLADADDAGLDGGANQALLGDEIVQFGHAEPLGGRRWRLTRLLRGRRGTETATPHLPGTRFVLLEPEALVAIDLPLSALGGTAAVMASGVGDQDGPVRTDVPVSGRSVLPPSPVHVRIEQEGDGAVLRWARRSRAGWRWSDGGDVPLAEEREHYRIDLADTAAETDAPRLALAAGAAPLGVRQLGTHGASPAASAGA